MSNSIQIAERTKETPKESSQNPKMMMITALMTALTTIAVSFISIVPNLRSADVAEIEVLKQKLDNLEKRRDKRNGSNSPDKKLVVQGTVVSKDGKRKLNGFDVYFLPEGDNLLTAKTDDGGKFYKEMPAGTYSIIVRESVNGMSGKGMLFEDENEVTLEKLQGAIVNYRMNRLDSR
ncbi:MAG: hypothetical protein ND895_29020 [Pyrinomonadaceae bacterium]|nr:hypothetical protein [Pyrinomonadaceae bacterium]